MFAWTDEMIRFMQAANAHVDYHRQLAQILTPKLSGCETICDAGCGLGELSVALSGAFSHVTAADVSEAALDALRKRLRADGIGNVTPLCCDLLAAPCREEYDAMIFCFFGRLSEIIPVARRQCRRRIIVIKKNYAQHRFSLTQQPVRGETAPRACQALREAGIAFTFDEKTLEYGQPLASLDEAVRFFQIYSRDTDPARITPQAVLPLLRETGDSAYPYYLPQPRQLGIITIEMEALR